MANNIHETQRIVGLLFQARIESDALNEVAKVLENKDKKIEALENHIARVTNTDNLLKVYKSVQKVQNEVKDLWGEGEVSKLLDEVMGVFHKVGNLLLNLADKTHEQFVAIETKRQREKRYETDSEDEGPAIIGNVPASPGYSPQCVTYRKI